MMDATFVLEESGVSATVEVPCDVDVVAAKEVACRALAVSPASVEMRIGTQVLEGTCRLQDTAFASGVQVVLAFRCADIRCPDELEEGDEDMLLDGLSLSHCGKLCIYLHSSPFSSDDTNIGGFDTETFKPLFSSIVDTPAAPPAISRCKTRYYAPHGNHFREVALPGGEVLRKVEGTSKSVFACGSVVVSQGEDGVSVYDEDLMLLRSFSHQGCGRVAVSHCGGWVITSSLKAHETRVWDVSTGAYVACATVAGCVAVSQAASAFAVADSKRRVHRYLCAGLGSSVYVDEEQTIAGMQFTPCGKYLVVNICSRYPRFTDDTGRTYFRHIPNKLHQYDVTSMSCVRVIPDNDERFAISPCSRVVVSHSSRNSIMTRHLYPHNSEVGSVTG